MSGLLHLLCVSGLSSLTTGRGFSRFLMLVDWWIAHCSIYCFVSRMPWANHWAWSKYGQVLCRFIAHSFWFVAPQAVLIRAAPWGLCLDKIVFCCPLKDGTKAVRLSKAAVPFFVGGNSILVMASLKVRSHPKLAPAFLWPRCKDNWNSAPGMPCVAPSSLCFWPILFHSRTRLLNILEARISTAGATNQMENAPCSVQ